MEFDDYLRASFRHLRLILLFTVLGLGVAYGVARVTPIVYDASVAVTIVRLNEPATSDYQYDAYYAMQATDLVAQTVVSWFGTPSFVSEVYTKAGFDPAIRSVDEVARRFRPKKASNQNVLIHFSDESRSTAEHLATAIVATLEERVPSLVRSVENAPSFGVEADAPVIVERKPKPGLTTTIGGVAGILVGLFIATAIEGVRRRGA